MTGALAVLASAALSVATSASAATPYTVVPFRPVAGNSAYLVYLHNTGTCTKQKVSLDVRDADGTIRTLNTSSAVLKYALEYSGCDNDPPITMSLTGSTLTTQQNNVRGKNPIVFWWNLKSHTHGQQTEPTKYQAQWAGSIPGGWLYTSQLSTAMNTTLSREGTDGKISSYGTFAEFQRVVTGTNGLLLTRQTYDNATSLYVHAVRYLPYGAAHAQTLAAQPPSYPLPDEEDTDSFVCTAVVQTYAACYSGTEDDFGSASYFTQAITPLEGSKTQACVECYGPLPYDFPYTTASARGVSGVVLRRNASALLRLLRPDGTTLTGAGHGVQTEFQSVFTAYGKLIVLHTSGNITEQSTPATKQYALLKA